MSKHILTYKLIQLRENAHLSQKQLAQAIGVNLPMYSRIESGERLVKFEHLSYLSKLLNVAESEMQSLWLADEVMHLGLNIPLESVVNALNIIRQNGIR